MTVGGEKDGAIPYRSRSSASRISSWIDPVVEMVISRCPFSHFASMYGSSAVRRGGLDAQEGSGQPRGFAQRQRADEMPGLRRRETAERRDVPALDRARVGVASAGEFADLRDLLRDGRHFGERDGVVLLPVGVMASRIVRRHERHLVAVDDPAPEQADVRDLPHRPVVLDLEDDAGERLRGPPLGRGHEGDEEIRERFDPDPQLRRAREHRGDPARGDPLPDQSPGPLVRKDPILEERVGGFVVRVREDLRHARVKRLPREGRDRHAVASEVPHVRERQKDPLRRDAGEIGEDRFDIRARPVGLVDEDGIGEPLVGERAEDVLGVRPDALHRGDHDDGVIEGGEGAFDLPGEVDVPGGVDQIDGDASPRGRGRGGADGDAAFPLDGEGIGGGRAVVDAARRTDRTHEKEQLLRQGGLPRVHMREDADIVVDHSPISFR